MTSPSVLIDVGEDLRQGREPFSRIMAAVTSMTDGQNLMVIAPFEPAPLFAVMARKGFGYEARQTETGNWEVRFSRDLLSAGHGPPAKEVPGANGLLSPALFSRRGEGEDLAAFPVLSRDVRDGELSSGWAVIELDTRGLEPPQPMVKILETLGGLPAGGELRARTDRRPMHLYAQLEARGFAGKTEEQSDGSFITHIRHTTA